MKFNRSSGVLLHPTSLPGPDGIGDLGPEAYEWINFLAKSQCGLWQVLPLGPTGYGDSPYQCFSAFAGNPYLISPALLMQDGLLSRLDLADRPDLPDEKVDYGQMITWKLTVLHRSYETFTKNAPSGMRKEYSAFKKAESHWLDDYTLFMAIKESQGGISWEFWPKPLRIGDESALNTFRENHSATIDRHTFFQFLFFRQWLSISEYAHEKKVKIIGDVPIFVSQDSADVWANPELFYISKTGKPTAVAGVPPDYFSPTGQLWGNPLFYWKAHEENDFEWWKRRVKCALRLYDIIRLDHFRGFAAYWKIPAGKPTAEIGKWEKGPGAALFKTLERALGDLPLIAEDLGVITPDVIALRDEFNYPGMRILQFAFGGKPNDRFLPHNYTENSVAYTGTHDNDTVIGWYHGAPEVETDFCRRYLANDGSDIAWDMIRAVWSSVAEIAVTPMQDLLTLDTQARMNYPSTASGNWDWRMPKNALNELLANRLRELNYLYSRCSNYCP